MRFIVNHHLVRAQNLIYIITATVKLEIEALMCFHTGQTQSSVSQASSMTGVCLSAGFLSENLHLHAEAHAEMILLLQLVYQLFLLQRDVRLRITSVS